MIWNIYTILTTKVYIKDDEDTKQYFDGDEDHDSIGVSGTAKAIY